MKLLSRFVPAIAIAIAGIALTGCQSNPNGSNSPASYNGGQSYYSGSNNSPSDQSSGPATAPSENNNYVGNGAFGEAPPK